MLVHTRPGEPRWLYEDWHEVTLTTDRGERIEFCCYITPVPASE